jgi:hypothetical protein
MTNWRTHVAKNSGLNTRRTMARVMTAALTAALVATGTSAAVAADGPGGTATKRTVDVKAPGAAKFSTSALPGDAPVNALYGVDSKGSLWGYAPNGNGGLTARMSSGSGWTGIRTMTQVDHSADGESDGIWYTTTGGQLYYQKWSTSSDSAVFVGNGWKIYDKVFASGNLGGAGADDLLARDTSGVLWLYLGYGNGKLTQRYKVGGGWNAYTHIAGQGDLTGDGKADIVAKDTAGVLWLYKGTGNYKAPFASRTKIGGGWNIYNNLISVGDINLDGVTDLVARDKDGALWLYKGTGKAAAPYASRVKIGSGGWNTYRLLF